MSAISHLAAATCGHWVSTRFLKSDAFALGNAGGVVLKGDSLRISQLGLSTEKTAASRYPTICMSLVDEMLTPSREAAKTPGVLAYDLVQGALVRWSITKYKSMPEPPTAVLLHGILGSRKNWGSFARRLAQEFPMWQFLLVDLRCHLDSAMMKKRSPHTVSATALDVLKLVAQLRLTPRILIGHSFGGKVALSMVDEAAKPLARPVWVWVLDATPGKVRPGGHKNDHPAELIAFLDSLPKEVASKRDVISTLVHEGFSKEVAQWVATSLRPSTNSSSSMPTFTWAFDLNGISELFKSYEETNMWKIVDDVPRGVYINFLKAERSLHRWALEDIQRIRTAEEMEAEEGGAVEMHVLEDAGHWVHADNPNGLFRILSLSFQMAADEDLEGFGFTKNTEQINGRAAIIGLLLLLDFELLTGKGLLKGTGFLDFICSVSDAFK